MPLLLVVRNRDVQRVQAKEIATLLLHPTKRDQNRYDFTYITNAPGT